MWHVWQYRLVNLKISVFNFLQLKLKVKQIIMFNDNEMVENDYCSETTESAQLILQNALMLSELSTQLIRETKSGEHYINSLNSLIYQAGKDFSSSYQCVESLLTIAKRLVFVSLQIVPANDPNFKCLKNEADKLLQVLDEIKTEDDDQIFNHFNRFVNNDNLSNKSLNVNVNEKYPEHCSRESLLQMSNIAPLPTVHEDIFADFNRPSRTLSSSSLKHLRKVKMCLQKVSDEDYSEETKEECLIPQQNACEKVNCGRQFECMEIISCTGATHIQNKSMMLAEDDLAAEKFVNTQ